MFRRRRKNAPDAARSESGDVLRYGLASILEPTGAAAEAYRGLRTNLLYTLVDEPPKAIVLTSPGPGEGKSTTCANLGVTLAQADMNVLMVDCDLRRPTLHRFFELRNLWGLTNVLVGERTIEEVRHEPVSKLQVVSSGPVPPNPAEVLGTKRFANLLSQARQEFDYVLLDSAPIGLVSDPLILASQSDGVLVVLDARETRKGSARRSIQSLETVGAKVLGTVMNNVKSSGDDYYGYTYK